MSTWKTVASFLDRPVRIAELGAFDQIHMGKLHSSVLLIVLRSSFTSGIVEQNFVFSLIKQKPLAIMFFGDDAKTAFDTALDTIVNDKSSTVVMTKVLDNGSLDNAVEDFLRATWPSEDRFDDWRDYCVLVIGAGHLVEIEDAIRKVCD